LKDYYKKRHVPKAFAKAKYDVDVYKILYKTPYADGHMVTASGAFLVPKGATGGLPLVSYQHGTCVKKLDAPSQLKGEIIAGWGLATDGYAVSMPDYLGLGEGEGEPLYIHAETEASASRDMLRAVRQFCQTNSIQLDSLLFLVGYSQGGHATMALHQMLETQYPDEFHVTACAPLSGPYDVSGVQMTVITDKKPYSHPGYLPYVVFSYNRAYHLYNDVSDILVHPYDSILPPLFDGTHNMHDVDRVMPNQPALIIKPDILAAAKTDTSSPFVHAMRDNDTYRWVPKAPVRMCYCEADEQVYYGNATVAYNYFKQHGAQHVQKVSMGKHFGHQKCALYALLTTKMWFDSFRKGSEYGRKGPVGKRFLLALSKPAMRKRQTKDNERDKARKEGVAGDTEHQHNGKPRG
jgi:predicted esterase